ncbi:hypothetical protein ABG067_006585 [Albugo candida]|uniref:Uncharacterized protein n=1 Tax=Albugo candida TaxID=65357 RepID=A0A024GQ15_9STRA|nr:unnamed protein product [Albugo candida]|eukprot:CCI48419.1 unnamed protein product [Albugo candida]
MSRRLGKIRYKSRKNEHHTKDSEVESERSSCDRTSPRNERQQQDMVALRALARSLQTTIEQFQCYQGQSCDTQSAEAQSLLSSNLLQSSISSHQVLDLESQVSDLTQENDVLRQDLVKSNTKLQQYEAIIRQCKADTIRARAELVAVASQLRDEQKVADDLRSQLLTYETSTVSRTFEHDLDQAATYTESIERLCRRYERDFISPIAKIGRSSADALMDDNILKAGENRDGAISVLDRLQSGSRGVEASSNVEKDVATLEQALKELRASLADVDASA